MEDDILKLMLKKNEEKEVTALIACNDETEKYGLKLTLEEAKELVVSRNVSLRDHKRIEFSKSILEKLIYNFCDSQYIMQDNYSNTLMELQDIFYLFKNESEDKLTDEELIHFMKEQFETICTGDMDYLADTCLERFAQAIRAGYTEYIGSDGYGQYESFDEEPRWDKELYLEVLKELFWR